MKEDFKQSVRSLTVDFGAEEMVTNTVPPPSLTKLRVILWECPCGVSGEFLEGESTIKAAEVEHLLSTGCGLSLQEVGSKEVAKPYNLRPIRAKLVLG